MNEPRDVLIRVHEIALKGRNRPMFVAALARNLQRATNGLGVRRVWATQMAVRVELEPGADWGAVKRRIGTVAGVAKFSAAYRTTADFDAIAALVREVTRDRRFATFRISARRADKRFPLTSQQLDERLGDQVRMESGAHVDLTHAELDVRVDVRSQEAFVYTDDEPGPGGLPVGTGGHVVALMSGGIDSPVAAWRMTHRGCRVTLVHFHSFPLVEGRSREKARELAEVLTGYQYDTRLYLVPFAPVQQQIVLSVPPPERVVLYRRFMVRIAEAIARRDDAKALVTGESLGQVGSQTLTNIATVDAAATLPVLRPLVAMDKQEIVREAQRIGTFDLSILPDEDCCQLFVPKSPSTAVGLRTAERMEAALPVADLVAQAVAAAEVREWHAPMPGARERAASQQTAG